MTTPAREVATEKLLAYNRQLEEFQKAWAAEVGAWLAWTTLASERGPADPDVVDLRTAWGAASTQRALASSSLGIAAVELEQAVRVVELEGRRRG